MKNFFPVLQVADVAATAGFYKQHLVMNAVFESDWYVQLRGESGHELAVMQWDHETIPENKRALSGGVLLSFEVEDVDAVHAHFNEHALPIERSLRDEDFGQRHFISCDPHGNLVDVITPIEPSAEYATSYSD